MGKKAKGAGGHGWGVQPCEHSRTEGESDCAEHGEGGIRHPLIAGMPVVFVTAKPPPLRHHPHGKQVLGPDRGSQPAVTLAAKV
jgi:hypothetical protein